MYPTILEIHSILRYVIFVLIAVLIIKHLAGWLNRSPFLKFDNILSTVTVSTIHLQLIIGLVLYFISPLVSFKGQVMQNEVMRYYTVEHIFMMLIAVVLFTVGRVKLKKKEDPVIKHREGFVYNMTGVLIIVLTLALGSRGIL